MEHLRTYICTRRKKIEKNPANPEYTVSEPWIGYRLRNPEDSESPSFQMEQPAVNMDSLRAKAEERKLSMVTCYDYTFARLLSKSPIDGILVGDSAAMVMQGHPSTLSASTELMRLHTEAVVRGSAGKFIVADMPFLSFRKGLTAALDAASILMVAGAHAVKLEGVDGHEDVVQRRSRAVYL